MLVKGCPGYGYSHDAKASCYEDEAEAEVKVEDKVIVTIFCRKKYRCIFTVK